MEHYRSTLATAALAVLGLVTATHILHPSYFTEEARPARAVVSVADAPAAPEAWIDPPAEPRAATAPAEDVASLLAPQVSGGQPATATMLPPLPSTITAPATQTRGDDAARRRATQRAVRARQAARARAKPGATAAPVAEARRQGPQPGKIDPLGDLLRGLGLDRDG